MQLFSVLYFKAKFSACYILKYNLLNETGEVEVLNTSGRQILEEED